MCDDVDNNFVLFPTNFGYFSVSNSCSFHLPVSQFSVGFTLRLANGAFVFFILFFFNLFESFFFCINEAWSLFFLQFIAYRLMGLFGDIFEDERYYIFDKMDFCEVS